MNIYLIICFCFVFAALCETLFPKVVRNVLFLCNGLFLLIVVGGRACGTDYGLYKRVIDAGMAWNVGWPIPFSWMATHIPWQLLIFLEALLTIVPVYVVFWKYTARYRNLMALFFIAEYFFMTLMQQSRQGVSIAFAILALFLIPTLKKAVFTNVAALSFHSTSAFGIVPVFMPKKYLKPIVYIVVYGFCILLGGVLLRNLLANVGGLGFSYASEKLIGYTDRADRLNAVLPLINARFVLFGCLIAFCYRFVKDERVAKLVNVLFFGICFYTFFISIPDLAIRGNRFFSYAYFFMLIFIIDKSNLNKNKKLIFWFISIAYAVYYLQTSYSKIFVQNDILSLVPYAFF